MRLVEEEMPERGGSQSYEEVCGTYHMQMMSQHQILN